MDSDKDTDQAVWYLAATPAAVPQWLVRLWRTAAKIDVLVVVTAFFLVLAMPMTPASAHELFFAQVVEMVVEPQGNQLLVRLHVPVTVLGDANLPRLSNRTLDLTRIGDALPIVAADIARNLDVQQGDEVLPDPVATARVGADRASIDVELTYPSGNDARGFSARVNAFRSNDGPVRTNLRYMTPRPGPEHHFSITGPAVRVAFDPPATDVLQQFVARGLRALLDGGDHLLFLVCVLLPVRRGRSAAALFAAGALGQTIAIALSVLRPPVMTAESLTALAMIAASMVVIAALQNVVRAHLRWVVPLAFAFGALNGFAFGDAIVIAEQFAGAHTSIAVAAFVTVVLLGELWLGVLAWATRTWLNERGVPERVVSVLASVVIAHSAMHRVVDRGQILAQAGSFGAERALVWLTLGWACVMMLVALANVGFSGRSGRSFDSHDPVRAAEAARPS